MILLGIAASAFVIGLTGALIPGPLLSVAVAESYKKGFWAGPVLVAGHAIPELALAVLFALGLYRFLDNDQVVGTIGVVGGLFLVWLGAKIFLEVRRGISLDLTEKAQVGVGPLLAGLWASVSNPSWIVWWATVGAHFILLSLDHGITGLVFFLVGHQMADLAWYSLVSFFVSRGRGRISDRVYHGVIYSCALLVFVFAGIFVVNGVVTLLRA